ncbi:hypothetical protein [Nocardia grenadensis]
MVTEPSTTNAHECGSSGRLSGWIDLDEVYYPHMDPWGAANPRTGRWDIALHPTSFGCNVCRLSLAGAEELRAARMSDLPISVSAEDLGPDFNPADEGQRLYGGSF